MKKTFFMLSALLAVFFCSGAALDIDGSFTKFNKNGSPASWRMNVWSGYKPFSSSEIIKDTDGNILHIFNVKSAKGFGWASTKNIEASAGDTVIITAQVKGKGSGHFGLQFRDGKRNHIGQTSKGGYFTLSDEWKTVSAKIKVSNTSKAETKNIIITLSGKKGTDLYVRNIVADLETTDIAGSAAFPREWMLFAPVPGDLQVKTNAIPATINNISGVRSLISGSRNTLDFSGFFPKRQVRNTGWAFAEMHAVTAEDHTFGVGADYFFALYINGKKVLDTLEKGNAVGNPPHFNNYLVTVPLKKGKNIIAVKFQSGTGKKAHLCIGGANDLRGLASSMAITRTMEKDDYESPADRPGKPQIINDIVSPGWLTRSNQAVYGEGKTVLSKNSSDLPPAGSDVYLAGGVRIQSFNGKKAEFSLGKTVATLTPAGKNWILSLSYNNKQLKKIDLPVTALPGDLIVAAKSDSVNCTLTSLGDSKVRSMTVKIAIKEKSPLKFAINSIGSGSKLTVDNYFFGFASPETKSANIPFKLELAPEFDPVKAGWKMVWNDEFDGDKIDLENKWFIPSWTTRAKPEYLVLKDGILRLRCEMKPGDKKPSTVGIRSRQMFQFGYFEARVRFTRHPGWWAAFWLLANGGSMTTAGGSELDVFEDYATRRADRMIANNYHTFMGKKLKSYGYTFTLPGSLDDFYVIGCKWTPFEVSVYLNGKLVKSSASHSPWQSLTYDAMHHAFPTSPNRVIVSGQCGNSGGKAKEPFVEEYLVDYVRVYAYPQEDLPQLAWDSRPENDIVKTGTVLNFAADAKPNAKTKSPITGVYLFDNGYLVDYKGSAPYKFDLPLTQERYDMCAWGRAGKSTAAPRLDGYAHSYQLATQDASGKIAITEPIHILAIDKESTPFKDKAAVIPGSIKAGEYDEGGFNVACFNALTSKGFRRERIHVVQDGSWLRYTVNVQKAGNYKAVLNRDKVRDITRGKNFYPDMQAVVFVNNKIAGTFQCKKGETSAVLENIPLPAGLVKLTVMPLGGNEIVIKTIDFSLK
ncbi:MAG: family 16 glycosylhydrolase [Lentisphaeria bacterium]|nr:family 16 glycosylhydrolase [Lentisphaeria bacterium]